MASHPGEILLQEWTDLGDDYSELARLWVSDDRAFVLVSRDRAWSPALLGSLLVECAHTAADSYASGGEFTRSEALAEIWRGFDEERRRLDGSQVEEAD